MFHVFQATESFLDAGGLLMCDVASFCNKSSVELRSKVTTMKYIKSHSKVPVPEVYGYCAEEINPVGAMCILMALAKGKLLDFIPKFPEHVKDHVYSQVARLMLEL